jgi:hypothetical protein
MASPGPYRRNGSQNGAFGIGSQLLSLSFPGESTEK